jgi:hypothetical protein
VLSVQNLLARSRGRSPSANEVERLTIMLESGPVARVAQVGHCASDGRFECWSIPP